MYLTRLSFDLCSAQVRRDLSDPYEMHRTLVRAFVADANQPPPRFLWRLEPSVAGASPVLLVQSETAADWSALAALPNYLAKPVESKELALAGLLSDDIRYRFRLFANPTVTRNGKRYGLASEDAQLAWLARQGERLGFEIDTALVTASDLLTTRKKERSISLQRACFEGRLRVTDAGRIASAVSNGIGHGKAFGLGLLSLARC